MPMTPVVTTSMVRPARTAATARVRAAVLALPLLAWLFDAAGTLDLASRGGRCATDCTAGVVQLPFAPTLTPLSIAGVGHEPALSLPAVVVAYAVVLALVVVWWWFLGGRIDRAATAGLGGRLPRPVAAAALYGGAVVVTFLVKVPALVVESRLGVSTALLAEVAVWIVLLRVLDREQPPLPRHG